MPRADPPAKNCRKIKKVLASQDLQNVSLLLLIDKGNYYFLLQNERKGTPQGTHQTHQ